MAVQKVVMELGDGLSAETAAWSFGGNTPQHFEDHVRRSVPHYDTGHELVLQLSDFFVRDGSVCYELGTSTGLLTRRLAERHSKVRWIGIDIEPAMIQQAQAALARKDPGNVSFRVEDLSQMEFEPADLVVAYYTIQFIPPRLRQEVINKIYRSLNWGGAFIQFEKVRGPDARFQDILTGLYNDFKMSNGYGPAEIIGKSRSLRGVLEPFSTQGNLDLLKRAGFVDTMSIFKHLCFEGYVSIK
ncbi:methyltransferase domain-containing protein [Corallococcus exercitus]|uniref:Methyltransferase domain-containing protein n=1 Tax=Corallococcus exercitus TaxID=2316736 RepID=A0A3A8J096_9BACT|nr:methyltransferase domain-containing protein [Corallococcus exercitus]NOK33330.1 methyltransferase domain-containing protein [Corallococcus exercitus]RKG82983.1 methyltransferase domain-containing protein [Corallococcus exercitus]